MSNREQTLLTLERFRLAATGLAVVTVVLGSFCGFGLGLAIWTAAGWGEQGGWIGRPVWTFCFGVIGTITSSVLAAFIRGGTDALCSVAMTLLGISPPPSDDDAVVADVVER